MKIVNEKTLALFRAAGPCEHCRKWQDRRDPHHVTSRGHGAGTRIDLKENLVGLCRACHSRYGDDPRHKEFFLTLIAERENFKNADAVMDYLYSVRNAPKNGPIPERAR